MLTMGFFPADCPDAVRKAFAGIIERFLSCLLCIHEEGGEKNSTLLSM